MQECFNEEKDKVDEIKIAIRQMREAMFAAQKIGDQQIFKDRKIKLDRLLEEEARVKSNGQEQKFALRHTPEEVHNFIDLIGYTKNEAIEITDRRI